MKTWKSRPVPVLAGSATDLRLHETSQNRVVALPDSQQASMYVCGITPYDATHMGHAATYVAFDLLNRLWLDAGKSVSYVQNVTDVDDPLLERANRDGVDWRQLAVEQTELFHSDMVALNVLAPQEYIGAVEAVEWIVPRVEQLVAAGVAYTVDGSNGEPDGDVYFSVEAASSSQHSSDLADPWWLGQISGLDQTQMMPVFAERGGDPKRPGKRHPLDALLWRVARSGEPSWPGATLGAGRPGWHIECTVIAQRFLPEPFTVQGGGSDLIFPHHEMGAGHAFALSTKPMAQHYAHTGMVGLDGEKMSKSLGNLVLVSKLRADGVDAAAIRLAIIANHYRSDWSWSEDLLQAATGRLSRWRSAARANGDEPVDGLLAELREALSNDLDAPRALAAVDAWAETIAISAGEDSGAGASTTSAGLAVDALLGIVL